jgi:hypothetical protein
MNSGAGLLLTGLSLFAALGFIGTSGATGTAGGSLPAPMCKSETHKQHNQKNHRGDDVFHKITPGRSVTTMSSL